MKDTQNELKELLLRFVDNMDSHDIYQIMKVRNLIEAMVLEAYENGKIKQSVADFILFPEGPTNG